MPTRCGPDSPQWTAMPSVLSWVNEHAEFVSVGHGPATGACQQVDLSGDLPVGLRFPGRRRARRGRPAVGHSCR
jgi:hypothetical protein